MTTNEQSATIPPPLAQEGERTQPSWTMGNAEFSQLLTLAAATGAAQALAQQAAIGPTQPAAPTGDGTLAQRAETDVGQNTGKGGQRNNATGGAMGARSRKAEGSGAQIERSSDGEGRARSAGGWGTRWRASLEATPFAREEGSGQTRMVQVLHAVRTKRIKLLETLYVIASRSQKRDN